MTLRARFGLAGHDRQTRLPGTDPSALPDPAGQDAAPHPDALAPSAYTPNVDGTETLFSGRVTAATTGYGGAEERTAFDVVGPWNSVKNASVASDTAAHLALLGFVHVDSALGLSSAEGSALGVVGAKRGNLVTGAGDDLVDVQVAANGHHPFYPLWSNEFRVACGAGDDEVRFSMLDVEAAARAGDATFAPTEQGTGAGPTPGYDGSHTAAWIDLGEGEDTLTVGDAIQARVRGGAGADRIRLGGAGTVQGGGGDDIIVGTGELLGDGGADTLSGRGGRDSLRGGEGDDLLDGGGLLEGGEGADSLSGGRFADLLSGGGGVDVVSGGASDDTLSGDGGDEILSGGVGWDTASFAGRVADYAVEAPSSGGGAIGVRDLDPTDGDEGADELAGVERLQFADRTVELPPPGPPVARFVFSARRDGEGRALWVTDGTAEGTYRLGEIAAGDRYGWIGGFFPLGDGRALFDAGFGGGSGDGLWVTDGTTPGTALVRAGGEPNQITALGGGRALFSADAGAGGRALWITDGTAAGTVIVEDVAPDWFADPVLLGEGRVLFTANLGADPSAYGESGLLSLWVSDGTAAGTTQLGDVRPHWNGSPAALGGGRAVVVAEQGDGPESYGREIWVTDGTAAGTAPLVRDLHQSPYTPIEPIALGDGRAVFAAGGGVHGMEPWITDGTAEGTRLIRDLRPGPSGGELYNITALGGGRALFTTHDGVHGTEAWITDGTAEGTHLIRDIVPGAGSSAPDRFLALGDGRAMFCAGDKGQADRELWVTDGTAEGTRRVADIRHGPDSSYPQPMRDLPDGRVLFSADDGVHGHELWVTDGTAKGTRLLLDIQEGPGNSDPWGLVPVMLGAAFRLGATAGPDPFA